MKILQMTRRSRARGLVGCKAKQSPLWGALGTSGRKAATQAVGWAEEPNNSLRCCCKETTSIIQRGPKQGTPGSGSRWPKSNLNGAIGNQGYVLLQFISAAGEEPGPEARPPFGAQAQPGSHVLTALLVRFSFAIVNLSFLPWKNKCFINIQLSNHNEGEC